jgi:hypothetical protein
LEDRIVSIPNAQTLHDFWTRNGDHIILGGLALLAVLIIGALLWAWRKHKVDAWLVAVTWVGVIGFSAEGMWVVATKKANVPGAVAAGVFFVAEALMIASMRASSRRYKRTTVREDDRPDGKVLKPGDPGKHGRAVWMIALAAGTTVAVSASNWPERILRFCLPLGAALLWWNTLTDEGTSAARSRWRWTPERVLVALGAKEPATGEHDLGAAQREQRVRQLVNVGSRVRAGVFGQGYHQWRLDRLTRIADEAMVVEAEERLNRTAAIVERLTKKPAEENSSREILDEIPGETPHGDFLPGPDPWAHATPLATAELPVKINGNGNGRRPKHDPDELRRKYEEICTAEPGLTKDAIAQRLGFADRTGLQYHLKKTEKKEEK